MYDNGCKSCRFSYQGIPYICFTSHIMSGCVFRLWAACLILSLILPLLLPQGLRRTWRCRVSSSCRTVSRFGIHAHWSGRGGIDTSSCLSSPWSSARRSKTQPAEPSTNTRTNYWWVCVCVCVLPCMFFTRAFVHKSAAAWTHTFLKISSPCCPVDVRVGCDWAHWGRSM